MKYFLFKVIKFVIFKFSHFLACYQYYFLKVKLSFVGRVKGVKLNIGKVNLVGRPIITLASNSELIIGDDVTFISSKYFNPVGLTKRTNIRLIGRGAQLHIGQGSGLSGVTICCQKSVFIGVNVGFGANCIVLDTDFHNFKGKTKEEVDDPNLIPAATVVIEDDVKIGMNVTILKGVKIGKGSVIAANSTVIKSCPPNSFIAGNPAKIIS